MENNLLFFIDNIEAIPRVVSPAEARGQITQFRHDNTVHRKVNVLALLKKDW